jgi:signal transduction histidine kinase
LRSLPPARHGPKRKKLSPPRRPASERLAAALEAERAKCRELALRLRSKDEALAELAHQLRNTLNAILGWVDLLRDGSLDPGSSAEGLEAIQRNAEMQSRLVDDMLVAPQATRRPGRT